MRQGKTRQDPTRPDKTSDPYSLCPFCKKRPIAKPSGKGRPPKTCGEDECGRALHIQQCAARRTKIKTGEHQVAALVPDAELAERIAAIKPPAFKYFAIVRLGEVDGLRFDIRLGGGLDTVAVHIPDRKTAAEYADELRRAAEYMERWSTWKGGAMSVNGMQCNRCKWWQPRRDRYGGGLCKRYPPTPFSLRQTYDVRWPETQKEDWCGEYLQSEQQ